MPSWFWAVVIILLILWALGLVTHVLGALINILLVIALVLAVVWLWQKVAKK